MRLIIKSPTKCYIENYTTDQIKWLESQLTYTNTSIQHLLKRHYSNYFFKSKNRKLWEAKLEELKKEVHNCLVFKDDNGIYIRPGSLSYIDTQEYEVINEISYPNYKKIAWNKPLKYTLYDYQEKSVEKLLQVKHGNVSLTTGSGKSLILLKLYRETGLRTVIMVPSASIFNEILERCEHHFGKGKVGALGNGKKRLGKHLTVAIGDSLANIKKGTPEWEFFSQTETFIVDESHVVGAETLESVCNNLFENAYYRFFLSATQTRGDGSLKLLQSIIGPTVHELTTEDAVKGGFICNHEFRIVDVHSSNPNVSSEDALEMKRVHFLRNKNIAAFVAKLANSAAISQNKQTLILVEELSQIAMLVPLLKVPYAYAHSEASKAKLEILNSNFGTNIEKVDSAESVEKFNKNEVKVLIGTSCIHTGTNIYPTHYVVNWIGGSSEIKTKQGAVGRSVRLHGANPHKDKCEHKDKSIIFDFDVKNISVMERHLKERIGYYMDSGVPIKRVSF